MTTRGLTLVLMIAAQPVLAATYHVSPTGSDANRGMSPGSAFRTIQRAADLAAPGDVIIIHAGTYGETLSIKKSGAPGRPITFQGQRGPKGEWLARIDPTVPFTGTWTAAPEIGKGVYKARVPGFEPLLMLVDGKFVPRIWPDRMKDGLGFKKLAYPPDQRVVVGAPDTPQAPGKGGILAGTGEEVDPAGRKTIAYWDTVGAMYGCHEGMIYLRFRDGDDPAGKAIRIAPRGGGISIDGQSWIVIRDLLIQGGQQGVAIKGPKADHNVVESCRLVNAAERISVIDASHSLIKNNDITAEFYSELCVTGAWGEGPAGEGVSDELGRKRHFYLEYKHFFGPRSTSDVGIRLSGGSGNEILGNRVSRGGQGIHLSRTAHARVHRNSIEGMSSIGITATMSEVVEVQIHENLILDCNLAIRLHHINELRQNAPRSLYVYRNWIWQRPEIGSGIFFHFYERNDADPYLHPHIAIYHNTFAGGREALNLNAHADRVGGLPQALVVNNVFSTSKPLSSSSRFRAMEGAWIFDHNWLGGSGSIEAVWYGRRNVNAKGQLLWDTLKAPQPALPAHSSARGAGLDLSRAFTVGGRTFGPLPGMKPGYFRGRAPDCGALEWGEAAQRN